jgi:hypothetical protein
VIPPYPRAEDETRGHRLAQHVPLTARDPRVLVPQVRLRGPPKRQRNNCRCVGPAPAFARANLPTRRFRPTAATEPQEPARRDTARSGPSHTAGTARWGRTGLRRWTGWLAPPRHDPPPPDAPTATPVRVRVQKPARRFERNLPPSPSLACSSLERPYLFFLFFP